MVTALVAVNMLIDTSHGIFKLFLPCLFFLLCKAQLPCVKEFIDHPRQPFNPFLKISAFKLHDIDIYRKKHAVWRVFFYTTGSFQVSYALTARATYAVFVSSCQWHLPGAAHPGGPFCQKFSRPPSL